MTANQLAYQANKIKEAEAYSNRMKAEAARQKSILETSQHLRDHGEIMIPAERDYRTYTKQIGVGLKDIGDIVDIARNFISTPFDVIKPLSAAGVRK